jgi:hypothetical protein
MNNTTYSGTNLSWVFSLMKALMFLFLLYAIPATFFGNWNHIDSVQSSLQSHRDDLSSYTTKLKRLEKKHPECSPVNASVYSSKKCSSIRGRKRMITDIKYSIKLKEDIVSKVWLKFWLGFLLLPGLVCFFLFVLGKWVPLSACVLLVTCSCIDVVSYDTNIPGGMIGMMVVFTVLCLLGHDRELWLLPRQTKTEDSDKELPSAS